MAYKHVIRAKTKNLLSDISVQSPVGVSYDKESGIFTIESNDKLSVGYSNSVMDFITPIPVGTVITVSIYCISGRYKATQGDNTAIGGYHKYVSSTDLNIWQGYVILPSGIDLSGKTFTTTWTVTKPLDAFWIYAPRQTDIIEEDIKFRAQLELGSTPTPYTPYNYLQSNKRMIKVSDVCQLLDKSKYPATLTEGGVTFTNNGDGTITANGTSTKNYAHYPIIVPRPAIGHKILVLPENNDKTQDHIYVWASSSDSDSSWVDDLGYGGNIITITGIGNSLKNPYTRVGINLNVNKDWVMNNHIYKPQLYDLTEMFGAGHEPATVAEFRQRFPNELYPYSPQCWLTSYKSAVVCKTKNLFDISKIVESTNLKNNKDGTITVSVYGVSGGLLKNLCPELKVGDVIKVYFQPLRWTAPNPPLVMVVGDVIFDRKGNSKLTVTEKSLNKPVLFYNNHYDERGLPGVTIIGNILITTDLTITNKNYNVRYTPYQHL